MTIDELELIKFGLNQAKKFTEPIARALQIIDREIKLKTIDPRKPGYDINGNKMDED